MERVVWRATAARKEMHALFKEADVPRTILYRWRAKKGTPTLPTIGKLERALDRVEEQGE